MSNDYTKEEKKLIFKAIRYWQRYQTAYESKDYHLCLTLLNRIKNELEAK